MDYVDEKYINLLSPKLEKFKKVKNNLYNCRCILCGDSKRNKNKARGYFYQIRNNTNYKCHNCGANTSLNNFIKEVDPLLHRQYCLEKFSNGHTGKNFPAETPKFDFKPPEFKEKLDLPKSSENKKIRDYLISRKLNPDRFYYAEEFKKFVNTLTPVFEDVSMDEERIVIPLYYKKKLIGIQGRAIRKSAAKYMTVMLVEHAPKVYGYDDVKLDSPVYILEGPFDSEFVDNSIGMCGADVNLSQLNISHPVYVYDNEPRNKEILQRMEKIISQGFQIVIWPSSPIEKQDINDMVLNNIDVMNIIKNNTFQGLTAQLKFNKWKRMV
jgi:hypothetical protein